MEIQWSILSRSVTRSDFHFKRITVYRKDGKVAKTEIEGPTESFTVIQVRYIMIRPQL